MGSLDGVHRGVSGDAEHANEVDRVGGRACFVPNPVLADLLSGQAAQLEDFAEDVAVQGRVGVSMADTGLIIRRGWRRRPAAVVFGEPAGCELVGELVEVDGVDAMSVPSMQPPVAGSRSRTGVLQVGAGECVDRHQCDDELLWEFMSAGGTDPITPYCSISHSAEIDLQRTCVCWLGPYVSGQRKYILRGRRGRDLQLGLT